MGKANIVSINFDISLNQITITDTWNKLYRLVYDSGWNAEKDYHKLRFHVLGEDFFADMLLSYSGKLDFAGNRWILFDNNGKVSKTFYKPHISSVAAPVLEMNRIHHHGRRWDYKPPVFPDGREQVTRRCVGCLLSDSHPAGRGI